MNDCKSIWAEFSKTHAKTDAFLLMFHAQWFLSVCFKPPHHFLSPSLFPPPPVLATCATCLAHTEFSLSHGCVLLVCRLAYTPRGWCYKSQRKNLGRKVKKGISGFFPLFRLDSQAQTTPCFRLSKGRMSRLPYLQTTSASLRFYGCCYRFTADGGCLCMYLHECLYICPVILP